MVSCFKLLRISLHLLVATERLGVTHKGKTETTRGRVGREPNKVADAISKVGPSVCQESCPHRAGPSNVVHSVSEP